ncbi:bifunctional adenosylcobinamide kinase/adenosylcobinamide-phosphate guanylyltransferase [Oceanobacillus neutriphilus]|uniref:Adenosylcobinamide kinase n=1 Tax=Oceanobacillus neutriphilus TaxID=531815 RepID=A0ABQ2P0S9_9BACI|nr:bifunctional adenosylcobinamide kinase/adenosylcobinamide-phosphate guanylyltransferase [Oceanobacillus neutriphilus]GGP15252.1 adenosylcobinamide kinase/adenosylcobinamide phosphate guanyltransferase [Oceanobacillus neutriphilus]
METEKLIFITGGVRSGKSAFAEQLAVKHARETDSNLHYIACGIPSDVEMQERIKRHQQDRKQSGSVWRTWEQPVHLSHIARQFTRQDVILLDCITTLLNNYLFQEELNDANTVLEYIREDITELCNYAGEVIIVSNEVLQDIPYENELTRNYQALLGNVHQQSVERASLAILVESGIPLMKKGRWK